MDRGIVRAASGMGSGGRLLCAVVAVAVLGLGALPAAAVTRNVPSEYPTIQAAIDAATSGDIIMVAAGTYYERLDWTHTAVAPKDIQLLGAGADVTTVDATGTGSGRPLFISGVPATARVAGFTFTGGTIQNGAGLQVVSSQLTIADNVICGNTPGLGTGGGVQLYNSAATLEHNVIAANSAAWGGGIYITGAAPILVANTIKGNSATSGGGVYLSGTGGTIVNNVVADNIAVSSAGGVYLLNADVTMTNNTVASNALTASSVGGAGILNSGGSPVITNTIICSNTGADDLTVASGSPEVNYCDIGTPDGYAGTNGNISADPIFDAAFRLGSGSPCIDAGSNSAPNLPATDLDGNPRIVDGDSVPGAIVDMGAYEYATANQAPTASPDSYEVDEDGILSVPEPGVLANDTDEDALTAVPVDDVDFGSLQLNPDGSFTYVPDLDFHGEDSFTYQAYDGEQYSEETTVTITVAPVNDPPTADGDGPYLGLVGQPVTLDASASSDPEGSPLTYNWRFGDGSPVLVTTEATVEHTFWSPDVYTVTLIVNDGEDDSPQATTEATIGEAGSGQADDVNAFLAFAQPAARKVTLQAGQTTYNVTIIYGPLIDPTTFKATLNNQNLGGFTPDPGTSETVEITLIQGKKNQLAFEVDGERTDGKTATDKDRFQLEFP